MFTGTCFSPARKVLLVPSMMAAMFVNPLNDVPVNMLGRLKVGDGSIYNGVWTTYSGRLSGPDDPLAKGPTDVTPSTLGDAFYARKFGSWHTGVVMFVFCDGSVKGLPVSTDPVNLRRFAVRNDGEVAVQN